MTWLLEIKGDPCALNMDRMSPLACAVFKDCAGNAKLLLQADPSTLKVHDANGDLPLHLALLEGSAATLQVLLDHGANWFDRNERGETSFDLYKMVLQTGDGGQGKLKHVVEVMLHCPEYDCGNHTKMPIFRHDCHNAAGGCSELAHHRKCPRQGHRCCLLRLQRARVPAECAGNLWSIFCLLLTNFCVSFRLLMVLLWFNCHLQTYPIRSGNLPAPGYAAERICGQFGASGRRSGFSSRI
jgi:hypothetical protein